MTSESYILLTGDCGETSFLQSYFPDAFDAKKLVPGEALDTLDEILERRNREESLHTVISCPIRGQPLMLALDKEGITPQYCCIPSLEITEYGELADKFAERAKVIPANNMRELRRYVIGALEKCGYMLSENEMLQNEDILEGEKGVTKRKNTPKRTDILR